MDGIQLPDDAITRFRGVHYFLSNFYPVDIKDGGLVFPTLEHAYQALKTKDAKWIERIRNADTGGKAKAIGRTVPLRADWDDMKLSVMLILLRKKFSKEFNPTLARMLKSTGERELVEGNTWNDRYWGMVYRGGWFGENHLGKLLMKVRSEL